MRNIDLANYGFTKERVEDIACGSFSPSTRREAEMLARLVIDLLDIQTTDKPEQEENPPMWKGTPERFELIGVIYKTAPVKQGKRSTCSGCAFEIPESGCVNAPTYCTNNPVIYIIDPDQTPIE